MVKKASRATASLTQTEFVAFDLETTGLDPVAGQIVEIGAIRFRGDGSVLGEFQQLIDPQCDIPATVTRIHGITNQMVTGQPAIADVLPRFMEFIGHAPVVLLAHNAAFDLGFMSVAFSRLGQVTPAHPVVDTCALARRRLSLPNYKLQTIGRHLRLIDIERHRALEDALLLKHVFVHLTRKRPAIADTAELCRLSPALSFESLAAALDDPPSGYEDLWLAISQRRTVAMQYLGGSTPGATRLVTPLGVTQVRGQLYLSALCHQSKLEKTFRLDRIAAYQISER